VLEDLEFDDAGPPPRDEFRAFLTEHDEI